MKRDYFSTKFTVILLFFLPFTIYLKSLAPTITPGDSGEFVAAAYTLGLPHPPSFPLFVLIGRLFACLPLGEIAFRVNLSGIVCAGLICLLLYLAAQMLVRSSSIAIIGAVFFIFTPGVWLQLNRSEVYGLYLVILAAVFLLWMDKEKSNNKKHLLVFFLALGFGAHPVLALAHLLAVLYLLLKRRVRLPSVIFIFTLMFFLYFFLPIRSTNSPLLNWGHPANYNSFQFVILAKGYDTLLKPSWSYVTEQFSGYFRAILQHHFYVGIIFVFFGAYQGLQKKRELNWLIFSVMAVNPIFLISSGISPWHPDFQAYLSCLNLALLFWGLFGLKEIVKRLGGIQVPLKLLLVGLVLWQGWINFYNNDQSQNFLAFDYAKNVINSINDSPAQLALVGDNEIFGAIYLQTKGKRKDVKLRNRLVFGNQVIAGREPTYYSYWAKERDNVSGLNLNGLLYEEKANHSNMIRYYQERGHRLPVNDYFSRWLIAQYYLPLLDYYLEQSNAPLAKESEEKILFFTSDIAPAYYRLGRIFVEEKDLFSWRKAARYFEKAALLDPKFKQLYLESGLAGIYNDLGLTLRGQNNFSAAVEFFGKAIEVSNQFHLARYNLAETWEKAGESDKALKAWEEYTRYAQADLEESNYVKKALQRIKHLKKR